MARTIATERAQTVSDEAVQELRQLRTELADATKDLSVEEYDALVEDLTHQVDDALRVRVRASRGETA